NVLRQVSAAVVGRRLEAPGQRLALRADEGARHGGAALVRDHAQDFPRAFLGEGTSREERRQQNHGAKRENTCGNPHDPLSAPRGRVWWPDPAEGPARGDPPQLDWTENFRGDGEQPACHERRYRFRTKRAFDPEV